MDEELERIRKNRMEELMKYSKVVKMEIKIEVNDNNFEKDVIEQSKSVPVVVDFWATWCMPCLMLGPSLERLAEEHKGKFVLAKLNVDGNPIISKKYGIMSIPAVKLFKEGKVIDEFVGALPEPQVRSWIDTNIGKKE